MKKENFAEGYDIFNGDVDDTHSSNKYYGEIHTGDEWIPARDKFCRPDLGGWITSPGNGL